MEDNAWNLNLRSDLNDWEIEELASHLGSLHNNIVVKRQA